MPVKPLPVAPLTEEDSAALMIATQRTWRPAAAILAYMRADRRDAALMLCLGVQAKMGTCYLRIGAENYAVPAVQVHVLKNPLFPTGAGYPFNISSCA